MADTKISALPAVATPAATDEFAVAQAGASKKATLAQIKTYAAGLLPRVAGQGGTTYLSGRYYDGKDDGADMSPVTTLLGTNQIRFARFFCHTTTTFDRIGIAVTTAAAGNARLGIWAGDAAGGLPGTLVLDAGQVSVAAIGGVELTISQSLTGDTLYWLGAAANVGATIRASKSGQPFHGYGTLPQDNNTDHLYASFTYGALASDPTLQYSNVTPPSIRLRAA